MNKIKVVITMELCDCFV